MIGETCARCAALLLLSAVPQGLAADTYPTKPIKLVIAFASGSATDSMGRVIAEALFHRIGQQVIVENRPGATGMLAATQVARSAPDGYTLLMTTNSTHGANSHIYKSLPYDPLRDFQPVVRTATLPFMLVINPSVPANTTAEFIAHAKAHRGELSYGTASTTSLIGAETINRVIVRRFPVARPRDTGRFGRLSELVFGRPHSIADELRWLASEGPFSPALVRHVRRSANAFDWFIFFSYRYYPAWHGARAVPANSSG